ncbi:hypothetical protein I41_43310 [Lacipirellula limnantheis]|uniref:Uncharacterized protein n=1 Tax=Lacipirellula limnantheis TaxID=2528024 RepID=A0A517U3B6_9BACT|nr:hypothetical protein I41_43310 [Lacipirellula limnantheis]
MAKYVRYALASVCFAASVACLALWWRSYATVDEIETGFPISLLTTTGVGGVSYLGFVGMSVAPDWSDVGRDGWRLASYEVDSLHRDSVTSVTDESGQFGVGEGWIFFPLWYPALIFALAGVASLRLGRRFTLRSALIATTIVAGLLGMAVIL